MTLWLVIYCVGFVASAVICGMIDPEVYDTHQTWWIILTCTFWPIVWGVAIFHAIGATIIEWRYR